LSHGKGEGKGSYKCLKCAKVPKVVALDLVP